jgi:hypothetical protein
MKVHLVIRIIAIISYCTICLMGMIIGIPFICYLFAASLLEWVNSPKQAFAALLGILGLIILISTHFQKSRSTRLQTEFIIFILLLSPIIERLLSVPLKLFYYPSFIIPFFCFLVLYPISIFSKQKAQRTLSSI